MDVFPSEISASFSRKVSCRGGGSAGREPKDSTSLFLTVNSKSIPVCWRHTPSPHLSLNGEGREGFLGFKFVS